MSSRRTQTELLARIGQLLLEYNESTGAIDRAVRATALAMTDDSCHVSVAYGSVTVSLAGTDSVTLPVRQIHYNSVVQSRVHSLLERVKQGELSPGTALAQLGRIVTDAPRHPRWITVCMLGAAGGSLAGLLGADLAAAMIAALATSAGLVARQELGSRHFSLLTLPLAAAFIGAAMGGLAIRFGLTRTPELVLIVPALMLVPGPHLINGVLDLLDNFVPMCLARLGLAIAIILAAALGIVLGIELTLPGPLLPGDGASTEHLNVVIDVLLAGIVTCGFALFYNSDWRQVGMAAVGGMAGHGLRFVALEADLTLGMATFFGGLAVGVIAAWMAKLMKTPVAIIAFAGAVTMMPGLHIYRALGAALKLARSPHDANSVLIPELLGNAAQACLAVGALALGLILGARMVLTLTERRDSSGIVRMASAPNPETAELMRRHASASQE